MRPLTHRAELLRIAAALGREAMLEAARGLGFEPRALPTEETQTGSGTADDDEIDEPAPPQASPPEEPIPFWQPRAIEIDDDDDVRELVRRIEARESEAEAARPWERGEAPPPMTEPLSPWRRTGPQLQRALTADRKGRRLDVRALVRRWCRGEHLDELPRRPRRTWVTVVVLVDRSLRLVPFWDDQDQILRELVRVLGAGGVVARFLPEGPDEAEVSARRWRTPTLCGVPVLALSDLGWYGGGDDRKTWLHLGRALRRAGQRIHALVPVPRGRWTRELARVWRAMPWERPAPGSEVPLATREREARADRLLRLLGPAMRIEPGLIRAVLRTLPREDADAGTEADLWARPELGEPFPEFRAFVPERADECRRAFLMTRGEDHRAVLDALRTWHWHEGRQPEAWHLEVLALARAHADLVRETDSSELPELPRELLDVDVPRAEAFMTWLAGDVRGGPPASPSDRVVALRTWCRFVIEQERSLWSRNTPAGEALQIIGQAVGGVEIPDLDPRLRALVDPPSPPGETPMSAYPVFQIGTKLVSVHERLAAKEIGPAPRVGQIYGIEPSAVLLGDRQPVRPFFWGPLTTFMVGEVAALEIRTNRSTLRLEPLTTPSWARAIGRDRFGLWAELLFKKEDDVADPGVAYRMRWIPPGRFLMGSPDDEPGRDDNEGPQHLVVITCGYWLGEMPVTQALWQAVTGENPSEVKTPDRPVESVTWTECQDAFIARLNDAISPDRGEIFRLPTEAEWEYACRAGTTTATYAGPIEIRGENDAPVLDAIAWYGGNSGVDFDLPDGRDSSSWPNKQHPHTRAGTRRVGQKLPNLWGLYDMLGNVLEWCSDWFDTGYYSSDRSSSNRHRGSNSSTTAWLDPTGPTTGEFRVYRGGSWGIYARSVRAAYRFAFRPGTRRGALGLRLARGQGVRQDPGGPEGPDDPEGR